MIYMNIMAWSATIDVADPESTHRQQYMLNALDCRLQKQEPLGSSTAIASMGDSCIIVVHVDLHRERSKRIRYLSTGWPLRATRVDRKVDGQMGGMSHGH